MNEKQDTSQLPVKPQAKWGWKTWGLLGLGGLCLACLVIGQVGRTARPATPVAKSEQAEPQEEKAEAPAPAEPEATLAPTDTPPPAETPTPEPTPTSPPTIGQDVNVGEIRWKFLEATDIGQELKSDNQFIESKTTGGKFVKIRFEIENLGTDAVSFTGIEILDNKARTFKPYQDRLFFIEDNEQCIFLQLNPNLAKTCTEIFELPADATGLKISVGDLQLFGDDAVIDLGL